MFWFGACPRPDSDCRGIGEAMPINYQQALEQIQRMGETALYREQELRKKVELARQLLAEYAGREADLRALIERAANLNPRLRCAMPTAERLDAALAAAAPAQPYALLAADGSQINPDRHSAIEFGAVNVGAVRLGPDRAPQEWVSSSLKFGDDLYNDHQPLTELDIAILRDLEERKMLFELAREDYQQGLQVITLTDGPLELFSQEQDSPYFKKQLEQYLHVLRELAGLNTAVAGYVDKPRSDYLTAALELALLDREGQLSQAGKLRELWPVRDIDLLGNLLEPGRRSAVFQLRSAAAQHFSGELALHYFYLNVGRAQHAHLARVEVPRWVAQDPDLLNLLQAALLDQSAQMGPRPFPYLLHRAHEVAVVHPEEKDQLEIMIAAELRRQGVEVGEQSNKQSAKELPGRTRMER